MGHCASRGTPGCCGPSPPGAGVIRPGHEGPHMAGRQSQYLACRVLPRSCRNPGSVEDLRTLGVWRTPGTIWRDLDRTQDGAKERGCPGPWRVQAEEGCWASPCWPHPNCGIRAADRVKLRGLQVPAGVWAQALHPHRGPLLHCSLWCHHTALRWTPPACSFHKHGVPHPVSPETLLRVSHPLQGRSVPLWPQPHTAELTTAERRRLEGRCASKAGLWTSSVAA